MSSVRVKICGITRVQDVRNAAAAGADMLGFVFAPSPRQLTPQAAAKLAAHVPPGIVRVGLFMNPEEAQVKAVLKEVPLDLLQFHGSEDNRFCHRFGQPFIKAIAMGSEAEQADMVRMYPDAQGLLYDSHAKGDPGGSGQVFDWTLLQQGAHAIWLAGGLTPDNVGAAVKLVCPWAVDVSSGVEDSPGIKNHAMVRDFILAAKAVDINRSISTPARRF